MFSFIFELRILFIQPSSHVFYSAKKPTSTLVSDIQKWKHGSCNICQVNIAFEQQTDAVLFYRDSLKLRKQRKHPLICHKDNAFKKLDIVEPFLHKAENEK